VVKPDHAIYKKMLEILGTPSEKVFYTDDRVELVESAKELGIKGFPFVSVEQLNKDLLVSGVNIN
jgi:FMN phosphatase YigB (HAD superfamily)